jgi:nucleoside-diphosphate-sugar epimerase
MASVLLTGAEGFTGRYVADGLRQAGYRVLSLVRGAPAQADHFQADLADEASLRSLVLRLQPDYVIHLAALAFVAQRDVESFYRVNLFGTLNLLDALIASRCPVRKVIVSSSANVYGNAQHSPVAEDTCPAPVNHYAMSKLAMEHMALTRLDNLPISITRPFNYTGVGQKKSFLIPKIIDHFKRRANSITLGNLDVTREFNDVRTIGHAYVRALEHLPEGKTINLCTGIGHKLTDIIEMTTTKTGHTVKIQTDPSLVRKNELARLVGDPSSMHQTLGDIPKYSISDTIDWMLSSED